MAKSSGASSALQKQIIRAANRSRLKDPCGAGLPANQLMRMPFQAWEPPPRAWRELRSYDRFLVQLTEDATAVRNRLHALTSSKDSPSALRAELKTIIASNDKRIERIRRLAVALIKADAHLKKRFEMMITIKGIAETSAVSIRSELATLPPIGWLGTGTRQRAACRIPAVNVVSGRQPATVISAMALSGRSPARSSASHQGQRPHRHRKSWQHIDAHLAAHGPHPAR